jgi:arylsulfatase A-like enzyme
MRAPYRAAFLSSLIAASTLAGCGAAADHRPTIVLIVTDDQRADTLWAMPTVRRELVRRGVTFTNAFVTTPLCCPSRASILTGDYAHTTGVWQNRGPIGGFHRFNDRSTIATWLRGAGYHTALFGKYLNGYAGTYVPPGWERWAAIAGAVDPYDLYYRYTLNLDGHLEQFGVQPKDYSLNVLTAEAFRYILRTDGPLFLYFAPYAPHTPVKPAPGDLNKYAGLEPRHPPSYDEPDVSDKPKWVRTLPRLSAAVRSRLAERAKRIPAALLGVDRAVNAIIEALRLTGRLDNAMIVFTSDNGIHLGEHRWTDKGTPYDESLRVPSVVRYDPLIRTPRTDRNLLLNIDLAPTIASIAGVRHDPVEGRSFVPLLRAPAAPWRNEFSFEQAGLLGVPAYCGVRTTRFAYVRYSTGEEELYDMASDPFELENRAADPAMAPELRTLRAEQAERCRRGPPGAPSGGPSE